MLGVEHRAALAALWLTVWLLASGATQAADRPRLTIYTASQVEQVAATAKRVAEILPEADVEWVRASTGAITDRILAERDHPRADIIYGLSAASMLVLSRSLGASCPVHGTQTGHCTKSSKRIA